MAQSRFGDKYCRFCGDVLRPHVASGDFLCDPCWEVSRRIEDYLRHKPQVLARILNTKKAEVSNG